jgi:hypothetical protein
MSRGYGVSGWEFQVHFKSYFRFLNRGPPTPPAFLRKSVEGIDWKGVVKRSWSKERQESAKERESFQNGKSGRDGEERWEWAGLARIFTAYDSMGMLVCQIVS